MAMEGDNPQVGVRVEDPADTPCLQNFQAGLGKERWNFLN